jgi:hypothetical protein
MNQAMSPYHERANRCLLCRGAVERECEGRFVTTSCLECGAVLRIEFDPPEEPHLRARIERLDEVDDCGLTELVRAERTSPRDVV